jgi:4-amino-4-deoxy-L-arabinose transferase-like glycosyltransferase
LLLPQALAGIASVYVLYRLVRSTHGEWPGLLAALTLAVTPISVVTNRNNAPDALLILVLLLSAWTVLRAVEEESRRWLLVTAILVGVAFNIKMLQLLLVAPALVVLYLVAAPLSWRTRLLNVCGATLVTLLVSVPWVIAVELTPPDQRPYVGGSLNNTVTDLIFGYNGLARLWGEDFTYNSGAPSPVRLFNDKLGGQASWLLLFALVGLGAAAWQWRQSNTDASPRTSTRSSAVILWTAWLIVQLVYFSIATFFHRYYLAMLTPAIAALTGIGADALWAAWRTGGRQRALVVIALLLCGGIQAILLLPFSDWSLRLIPPLVLICLVSAAILLWAWRTERPGETWQRVAFTTGVLALLIAPVVWTLIPVLTCTDYTLPYGGPQVIGKCLSPNVYPFFEREWLDVFEPGRNGARFLAATHDMGIAELGILQTHEPFMAIGGFRGNDPILTVEQFAEHVERGEVRFYTAMQDEAEFPIQEGIRQWVKEHCPPVSLDDTGIFIWGPCEAPAP